MATMYSLFFGVLFAALCSDNGDGGSVLRPDIVTPSYVMSAVVETSKDFTGLNYNRFLCRSVAAAGPVPFLLTEKEPNRLKGAHGHHIQTKVHKGQGLVARLNCLLISGNKTTEGWKPSSAKLNSSLKPRSAQRSKTFYTKEVHPLAIVKNLPSVSSQARFVGGKLRECMVFASNCLLSTLMSLVKQVAIKDDLLAYGDQGRKATNRKAVYFALGQESQSKGGIGGQETLGTACVALRSHDEHRVNSLDLCGTFYQGKVPRQSAIEDRIKIINIASTELGVREATGNNDGPRVEEYLRYTNLGKGYEWCAAFVSWVYGQAGFAVPRNPWSPALFPKARHIAKGKAQPADVFGIYGTKAKRINHVGLVKELSKDYLITIEGNSNDRVESRRRHLKTVYAVAEWVN